MDLAGLLVFAAAYLMAAATPGSGAAAAVARTLARGPAGSVGFIAGSVRGLLLFLAWKLWSAPAVPAADAPPARPEKGARLFLAGLTITLGNPKVTVFFLALLPAVLDLGALTLRGFGAGRLVERGDAHGRAGGLHLGGGAGAAVAHLAPRRPGGEPR